MGDDKLTLKWDHGAIPIGDYSADDFALIQRKKTSEA